MEIGMEAGVGVRRLVEVEGEDEGSIIKYLTAIKDKNSNKESWTVCTYVPRTRHGTSPLDSRSLHADLSCIQGSGSGAGSGGWVDGWADGRLDGWLTVAGAHPPVVYPLPCRDGRDGG